MREGGKVGTGFRIRSCAKLNSAHTAVRFLRSRSPNPSVPDGKPSEEPSARLVEPTARQVHFITALQFAAPGRIALGPRRFLKWPPHAQQKTPTGENAWSDGPSSRPPF